MGWLDLVITQNVDRLHHKGGSGQVLELHGTTHRYGSVDLCMRRKLQTCMRRLMRGCMRRWVFGQRRMTANRCVAIIGGLECVARA
jgi:NAD-dependent SIR2 family protein deacetylase